MVDKTVRQLADYVKTPLEQLLKQLQEAGLSARTADDIINDEQQMQLLTHLRKSHVKCKRIHIQGARKPGKQTYIQQQNSKIKNKKVITPIDNKSKLFYNNIDLDKYYISNILIILLGLYITYTLYNIYLPN